MGRADFNQVLSPCIMPISSMYVILFNPHNNARWKVSIPVFRCDDKEWGRWSNLSKIEIWTWQMQAIRLGMLVSKRWPNLAIVKRKYHFAFNDILYNCSPNNSLWGKQVIKTFLSQQFAWTKKMISFFLTWPRDTNQCPFPRLKNVLCFKIRL